MQGSTQQDHTKSGALRDIEAAGYFQRGRRAGLSSLPLSDAEGQPGSWQLYQWTLGWRSGDAARRVEADRRMRSLKPACRYTPRDCDCGGRGHCLDVA